MIEQSVPPESYYFKEFHFDGIPYAGGTVQHNMGANLGATSVR
jgi:hypothetical protein